MVGDRVNIAYQDKGGMLIANSVTKAESSQDPTLLPKIEMG
jgi:hypothetical protein